MALWFLTDMWIFMCFAPICLQRMQQNFSSRQRMLTIWRSTVVSKNSCELCSIIGYVMYMWCFFHYWLPADLKKASILKSKWRAKSRVCFIKQAKPTSWLYVGHCNINYLLYIMLCLAFAFGETSECTT